MRVSAFRTGILGVRSESVFISGSNISDNDEGNIHITEDSNAWRIRDGLISQAGRFGISVSMSNDLLVDGVRMESNFRAAIRAAAQGTRIINNRFEGNGRGNFQLSPSKPGILVTTTAQDTRILTNLFEGDCILDEGTTTERAFNIPSSRNVTECTSFPIQIRRDCFAELVACRNGTLDTRIDCVTDCAKDTENYLACMRDCNVTTQNNLAQCRAEFEECQ